MHANRQNGANGPGMGHFRFIGCVISDVGLARPNNEDNYVLDGSINIAPNAAPRHMAELTAGGTDPGWHIAGVFDGIGGGENGQLAAHTAAEVFSQAWLKAGAHFTEDNMDLLIRQCFLLANNRIAGIRKSGKSCGTTGTVLCTNGSAFKLYHLGDSRAYLFRESELFQLTKDQTLAQLKIDTGIYPASGLQVRAEQHILTEFIGRDQTMENTRPVESQWISLQENDCLLLCSDGLYDLCEHTRISSILASAPSAKEAAEKLTDTAISCGGTDNITCLVIAQNNGLEEI